MTDITPGGAAGKQAPAAETSSGDSEVEKRFAAEETAYAVAETRVRDAAVWVISAFAAIGGLLLVGIQLTALANADGDTKGWAIAAVALTVLGALVVIVAHVTVLTATAGNLREVVRRAQAPRKWRLLRGYQDGAVADAYSEALVPTVAAQLGTEQDDVETLEAFLSYFDQRIAPPSGDKPSAQERRALNLTMARIKNYLQLAAVRYRFRVAMRWLVVGGVASAVGVVWFATLTGEADSDTGTTAGGAPAPAAEVIETEPVLVEQAGDNPGELESMLGEGCVDGPIEGFMISTSDTRAEIVTVPSEGCPSRQISITTDEAVIRSACPVSAPTTTTTIGPTTTSTTDPDLEPPDQVEWVASPCV